MRDVIKKILKEETDFDWIKENNPRDEIVKFTEEKLAGFISFNGIDMKTLDKNIQLYQLFENWHSAMIFLITDTQELAQFAENVNHDGWSVDERLDALNMMEDYLPLGSMIEDTRRALTFFKPLMEKSGYHLSDILKIVKEHYNR